MVAASRIVCATTPKRRVDVQLSESLLFLHAISGYDTSSRPHGIGKVGVLKKYAALAESAATFMANESGGPGKSRRKDATYHVWKPSSWSENCKAPEVSNENGHSSWIRTTREASADMRCGPSSQSACLSAGTSMERELFSSWGVGMGEILNRPCSCEDVRASSPSAASAKHHI